MWSGKLWGIPRSRTRFSETTGPKRAAGPDSARQPQPKRARRPDSVRQPTQKRLTESDLPQVAWTRFNETGQVPLPHVGHRTSDIGTSQGDGERRPRARRPLTANPIRPRSTALMHDTAHPGSVDHGAVAVISGDATALRQRFTQTSGADRYDCPRVLSPAARTVYTHKADTRFAGANCLRERCET
jgi:hypothetical protein